MSGAHLGTEITARLRAPEFDRYEEVLPRLRRVAEKRLPRPLQGVWEVDDLIDEALTKTLVAFQEKKKADPTNPDFFDLPVEAMRKYLRAAIIAVAVDLTRRLLQKKGPGGAVPGLEVDPRADHTSPTERARRGEALAQLTFALAELPADQCRAIQLHHFEELPYAEVAREMGTTRAAVAGLIRRGLARLRERLPGSDFGLGNDD